jgi:hypothetical protein
VAYLSQNLMTPGDAGRAYGAVRVSLIAFALLSCEAIYNISNPAASERVYGACCT